ncbi:MAG: protein translocase subunit SecF [Clostridia bacterium]|nr:protein translocase subunit SecF [Clostridia bacterium]
MRNFDFCQNWKKIFIIPVALIVLGVVLFFAMGLNVGVDFSGGSMIYAEIGSDKFDVDDIRDIVNDYTNNAIVSYSGDNNVGVDIRLGDSADVNEIQDKIIADIIEKYGITEENVEVEYVGPTIGRSLIVNASIALAIAFVLMLVYIWFRFELFSGLSALIALVHDVLITFVFVILFNVQLNTPFIAAILTIIGYSINNTIIIFDRIRSNATLMDAKTERTELVNVSVRETFSRSVNTTITTLIALVVLYIIGVESIRTFVLPIIVGVCAGFFSSVFMTGPLWCLITKNKEVKLKKVKI